MLKGFKDFIARGNVIDLAVGVIMGGAFGAVVSSLVADVITPALGMAFGKPDFSGITLGSIMVGKFLNAIIAFLLVSIGVYFFIVLPINKLKGPPPPVPPPGPSAEEKLLVEIRDLLARR
ncbi:MAG: large conductance mechanosensitive channel protein MscL [Anaeromyxobacter sp.]|nr:large conductance mechanosensitive channel protein MscL [Anaeromyxobacter sp.]MBL0278575.1 large conductance mechanosensitive channel protein MscL [Anaeromyxobacter sp.]